MVPAPMWRTLSKDWIARAVAVGSLLLWVPLYLPFAPLREAWVASTVQAAALLASIAVCLWRLWERPPVERRFWSLVSLSLGCWLGVHLLEVAIDGNWGADLRISLLGDTGYFLLYLLLVLALELQPHASPERNPVPHLRLLALLGASVFAVGLYVYTVVVAMFFDPDSYATWVPSECQYAVFDLYLTLRLASLALSVEDSRWRATYSWLFVATLGWLSLDSTDLLSDLEVVVNTLPERVQNMLWFVTPCVIAMSARISAQPRGAPLAAPRSGGIFQALWGGPLLTSAILFALVHLHALVVPAAPAVSGVRQWVAFSVILMLFVMALASQRMLARENRRLALGREAVNERVRLAQRLEALGRLTGGVAHDFNNVLQVIRMCGESLMVELDPRSPHRQQAAEIVLATERASGLTARLLAHVRERPAAPVDCDLNENILRTAGTLRRIIGEDIRIETELDPGAGTIRADATQLEHALLNLGVNARDAMPRGGTIRITTVVRTKSGERWTELAMRDEGVGMDIATRGRIFEPFFTTKNEGAGTGLGLALVKSFVDELGGRIEVDSMAGMGTTFRIFLRSRPGSAGAARDQTVTPRLNGSATVLLVEDEVPVRAVISGYLRDGGFRVIEADNGTEALVVLERELPDLVVTDLTMPHMGGVELASRIDDLFDDLPVVFVTGYIQDGLASSTRPWSVLRKPFSRAELDAHLRTVLATLRVHVARKVAQRPAPDAAAPSDGTTTRV
jgi:signal transduction histidine kinase